MKRRVLSMAAAIGLTLLCVPAYAGIVTFNSFAPTDSQGIYVVSDGGLTFSGGIDLAVWNSGSPNSNGTPGLIDGYDGVATITRTGGGAFDLNSFEMTLSFYTDSLTTAVIPVTAYFSGGGSASQNIMLKQGLQAYGLGLLDVVSVDIGILDGGYWLMDNVEYDAATVPEPASLLLFGTGLVGAVRAVRKRRG
jgi:hypothetical protein